jgi:thiamine pyrophosphate-dependent acetolactate synthase large subunit-like protein
VNATSATRALLDACPDALVVAALGTAVSALREASDDGPHLYMGGAMGSALGVALGVADRRPDRRVLAILGDGETLMGASTLWSVASLRPPNLLVAILTDGRYAITGGQDIGAETRFPAVAAALGLETASAASEADVTAAARALAGRTALLEIRYADDTWPGPSPFVDPPVVRARFESHAADGG